MDSADGNRFYEQANQRQQGVLWKRRDVFKNKWRPRWFDLQPQEAVLTYFLLSKTDSAARTTISTPLRRSNNAADNQSNVCSTAPPAVPQLSIPAFHSGISDLMNENTNIPDSQMNYDVVPRGTIYLAGCTVTINDKLSLPRDGLFAFTIVPPNKAETECHLAARSEAARAAWVENLSSACNISTGDQGNSGLAVQIGEERSCNARAWKSLDPPDKIFHNVPDQLAAKLGQSLESYLELSEDVAAALDWTPIFQDRNGVSSFQRQDLHSRTFLKSTAIIPHHPKQLLNLLLDMERRQEYEPSTAISERLDVLSNHVFLDYYAFKAVWPTSPRDFAVVIHWQALQRQLADGTTEEALVILAFSCLEAENLRKPSMPHIRATLHASFYLLRLVPPPANNDKAIAKCRMTRILSYDLGGSLPRNLTTTVLMQQACVPAILSKHLAQVEPSPDQRLCSHGVGLLNNENVIADVVEMIIQRSQPALASGACRNLNLDQSAPDINAAKAGIESHREPEERKEWSAQATAASLLMPLLLHRLASTASFLIVSEGEEFWFMHPSSIFLFFAFVTARLLLLPFFFGEELSDSARVQRYEEGTTAFRFNVELQGVLRFIRIALEEKREPGASKAKQASAEVSIVHIVAIALARVMQNNSDCWNCRRVSIPFLFKDGLFRYPSSQLDVSLSFASGRLVCLNNFAFGDVQTVADAMLGSEQHQSAADTLTVEGILSSFCHLMDCGHRHGQCLIILTETDPEDACARSKINDAGGVQITTLKMPNGVDVAVTIVGVGLQRSSISVGSPPRAFSPKPTLSLLLTINTSSVLDTARIVHFAEDLQKLIRFPELCEK